MNESMDRLSAEWAQGYSIAELWGMSKPVSRGGSALDTTHVMLWGILSIVEYQVSQGAGHRYVRDRLWHGDWVAIGFLEPKTPDTRLTILPQIKDAKFGRKQSAIGDGVTNYADVRILHSQLLAELTAAQSNSEQDREQRNTGASGQP